MSKSAEQSAEQNALGVLQLILADAVAVLRDENMPPEARGFAHRTARNIVAWDAGTGLVTGWMSLADRAAVASNTFTYSGSPASES